MKSGLSKEILILVLLFIVIIFILIVLLYDFIPGKKENIKSVEYVAENSVSDVLQEIKENTGVDIAEKNSDVPLKSYSIDSEDLDVYASENSYESGKSDPFAENSNPAEGTLRTTTQTGTSSEKESQAETSSNNKKETNEKEANIVSIVPRAEDAVAEKNETKQETKDESKEKTNTTSSEGVFFEQKDSK